ncbi:hypothetical protein T484DRAFT_1888565, partial [Baffinella frigidus]
MASGGSEEDGEAGRAGIGLTFQKPDALPGVVVKRVKDTFGGGPVSVGDRILAIDGLAIGPGIRSQELRRAVMGETGSRVVLSLLRPGASAPAMVQVVRGGGGGG